jgi:DNA invertase Pin-like site-specific DNA recombinase
MNSQANTKDTHSRTPQRAVCYLRVASALDRDSTTAIKAQRATCESKAREIKATIVDEYADVGTGSTIKDRPALQTMLTRLESEPRISCVIVYDHARLARNIEAYREIIQALKKAGVELAIAKEPGPHYHRFMQTLTTAMAELDAQNRRAVRRAKKVVL